MKTILKWPGGKEKELPIIREFTPNYSGRFVEPFVGGGAVFFDVTNNNCCINDKSTELINLYKCVQSKDDEFISFVKEEEAEFTSISTLIDENQAEILDLYHSLITVDSFIDAHENYFSSLAKDNNTIFIKEVKRNLSSKIKRSQKLEFENGDIPDNDRLNNIEAALKSAYYMFIRYLLNHSDNYTSGKNAAIFFFIREYCYSSMFRYNVRGEFNVPYGGISYNRKAFNKKIEYLLSEEMHEKLKNTIIESEDFEIFLDNLRLTTNDFVFLDPPYDSDFSTYAQNTFGQEEQTRLCEYLKSTPAKILLVIKNTEFIYNLYKDDFNISSFDKNYLVSFMNRNDRKAEHLLITNY